MYLKVTLLVSVCVIMAHSSDSYADETKPKKLTDNSNAVIKQHHAKLKYSCSSYWGGWEPQKAFDGDPQKSWFTARGDAAAFKKKPWIAVEFPIEVTVKRVTLLGNREPPWQIGYTILVGRLELLDKNDRVLYEYEDEIGGSLPDMEARPKAPIKGVKKLRFTSLSDEGDQNQYQDIAIGEVMVE